MADELTVRRGSPSDVPACLEVLSTSYSSDAFTDEWFSWKHRECPFGPSRIYLAEERGSIVGLFCALPWRFATGERAVESVRLVDGAVLPAARGRGVLGRLVVAELAEWDPSHRPGLVVATATPEAQRSHSRNGATTLEPIHAAYGLPRRFRREPLHHGVSVLDSYSQPTSPRISTAWTVEALRWRIDPRSGHQYRAASLADSSESNGMIYRAVRRRWGRVLIPLLSWGDTDVRGRLLGAVARTTQSSIVLAPVDAGATTTEMRPLRTRSGSVVCVWDRRRGSERSPEAVMTRSDWSLSMADLEGLI